VINKETLEEEEEVSVRKRKCTNFRVENRTFAISEYVLGIAQFPKEDEFSTVR